MLYKNLEKSKMAKGVICQFQKKIRVVFLAEKVCLTLKKNYKAKQLILKVNNNKYIPIFFSTKTIILNISIAEIPSIVTFK
jgi:hypothetical protein